MRALLSSLEAALASSQHAVSRRGNALVIAMPGGSRSVLAVEHERDGNRSVALLAPICDEAAADPRDMLHLNGELGSGAIAIVDGCYVVRFAVPATQLASAPLLSILAYVHDLAASLVPAPTRDAAAMHALAYLAA